MAEKADLIAQVETEVGEYVGLQHRLGHDEYDFADSLLGHRRQCIENLRDSGEEFWVDRIRALDTLAARKGISVSAEVTLTSVISVIAERKRRERADRIQVEREARALAQSTFPGSED